MGQAGFLFDLSRCTGCNACEIACRDRHDAEEGQGLLAIHEREGLSPAGPYVYHLPFTCFHCIEPPCVPACPEEAIVKREEDGIVLIGAERCTGCLVCIDACPFGALRADLKRGLVAKCDYCVGDSSGVGPTCVEACPLAAIEAGSLSDLKDRENAVDAVRGFPDASGAGPAIVFIPVESAVKAR